MQGLAFPWTGIAWNIRNTWEDERKRTDDDNNDVITAWATETLTR